MSRAIAMITDERVRQVEDEGYLADHDDAHEAGEIAMAAACYASGSCGTPIYLVDFDPPQSFHVEHAWPWERDEDKRTRDEWGFIHMPPTPDARIRLLVKAGALIVAEIDRLLRIEGERVPAGTGK